MFHTVSSSEQVATRCGAIVHCKQAGNQSTNNRSHLSVPNADSRRDEDILQDDRMPAACRSGPAEL